MQVNLHGTPCSSGVFLYSFGHTEKHNLAPMGPRKYAILILIYQKFSGGGTAPSPDPSPCGEGDTPSPHPTPLGAFGASIRLAPSALGTALFSTPNRKMPTTALCILLLMSVKWPNPEQRVYWSIANRHDLWHRHVGLRHYMEIYRAVIQNAMLGTIGLPQIVALTHGDQTAQSLVVAHCPVSTCH